MSRVISVRAREQVRRALSYWLEDHAGQYEVRLDCIFVDDFDGTRAQMLRLIAENMSLHGFRVRTRKGVKWLVRDPGMADKPARTESNS